MKIGIVFNSPLALTYPRQSPPTKHNMGIIIVNIYFMKYDTDRRTSRPDNDVRALNHWPRSTFHLFSVYSSTARDLRTPIITTTRSSRRCEKKPKTVVILCTITIRIFNVTYRTFLISYLFKGSPHRFHE